MRAELTEGELIYYQTHPVEWIEEFLEAKFWWKQKEIAEAIAKYPKITVRSGHGMGKSYGLAGIAMWFVFTHPYSRVIITSPTFFQTVHVIFEEIKRFHEVLKRKMTYAGDMTQARLRLAPGWFIVGRNVDNPHAFIGQHSENLMVIYDEAAGIPREIFDASKGVLTSETNKAVLIGNPIPPATFFHETHTGEVPGFHKIRISCFDSPNVEKGPDGKWRDKEIMPFPAITSMTWINDMRNTYGEKNPFWISKVLGEFPTAGEDMLIDGRWLAAAIQKGIYLREVVNQIDEGSEILSSQQIAKIMGR
jgi:phage terminase large subunit